MSIEYEKTGPESFHVRTARHSIEVSMLDGSPVAHVKEASSGATLLDTSLAKGDEIRMGGIQFTPTSDASFVLRLPDACIEAEASGGYLGANVFDHPWPTADAQASTTFETGSAFAL